MASGDSKRSKYFTFFWKLENVNCVLQRDRDGIVSPKFTIHDLENLKLKMIFARVNEESYVVNLVSSQEPDEDGEENVEIDNDIAILLDGIVVHSQEITKRKLVGNEILTSEYKVLGHILFGKRFVSQDILTIRCRVWKSVGEFSERKTYGAYTRFEKKSFLWEIKNFSGLEPNMLTLYDVKSMNTRESVMTLGLILTEEEIIRVSVIRYDGRMYLLRSYLSLMDSSGNIVMSMGIECVLETIGDGKEFPYILEKKKLLEKKDRYLPNDILSLKCECTFEMILEKMEIVNYGGTASENSEIDCLLLDRQMILSSKRDLVDNFKLMLNNGQHSDIKLRTGSKTYPVHKCVLSSRSPVFKAMFENEMKETISQCVDISDLSDDTILRMLQFIYCADVEELEWGSAIQLYEAADKYEILSLKDICSSYLKSNMHRSNVCEALVVADLHQDENLKKFSQNFILNHGEDIINSEDWKKMMQTHLKLAAETMGLKFKK